MKEYIGVFGGLGSILIKRRLRCEYCDVPYQQESDAATDEMQIEDGFLAVEVQIEEIEFEEPELNLVIKLYR